MHTAPRGSSLLPAAHASLPAEIADLAALRESERGERIVSWTRALLATAATSLLFVNLGIPALSGRIPRSELWVPVLLSPTAVLSWVWIVSLRYVRFTPRIGRLSAVIDVLLIAAFFWSDLELRGHASAPGILLGAVPPFLALMFMIAAAGVRQDPVACLISGSLAIATVTAIVLRANVLVEPGALAGPIARFARPGVWLGRGLIAAFTTAMVMIAARNARRMARETGTAVAEQDKITGLFGRYVDPDIAREVMANEGSLAETREVTVLFTDLRDFTAMSEKLAPADVLEALNAHYAAIVPVVHRHGGTVNKFIGDAIMATFGAPIRHGDHARRAVAAAVDMLHATETLNASRRRVGRTEFKMGVGIATGTVVVGTLGADQRVEYAVIGDTVNTASRLEGLCKQFAVSCVIAATTREQAGDDVPLRALGRTTVKGKTEHVDVYTV